MRLSAINPTNSAFCMFAFDADFFLNISTESKEKIECQIQLKNILAILKTRGRNVERVSLIVSTAPACRFSMILHCQHCILKTHHFSYSPKRGLVPSADPNPRNFFSLNASTATEWLEHFLSSSRSGELCLVCTPDTCTARSKQEDLPDLKGGLRKSIATQVNIGMDEFKEYCVLEHVSMTFSLREFKATVSLAEAWRVPFEVNFSSANEPIFVRMRLESGVAAEFVIATTNAEKATQACAPDPRKLAASMARSTPRSPSPPALPYHSTPLIPIDHPDPLFFPSASQLSPHPTQQSLVQPTPVAQGGDPTEFLDPLRSRSHSPVLPTQIHPPPVARKRFKPLF